MPIRGSQQVAEALKMLGLNLPGPAPMPDMQPGMPGYDPTTLANRVDNPSVMDPTWLNVLRTGQNTLERVGQMGKGLITGGAEQPGPSAENLGAILGVLGPLLGKIVYHGSPHVFDKFDMGKIGTGEGAQAYGHGLYFADAPAVAREYQNLGGLDMMVGGKPRAQAKLSSAQRQILDYFESNAIDPATAGVGEVGDAFMRASKRGPGNPKEQWDRFKAEFDKMKPLLSAGKSKGALYNVDLPDDAIAKMLDWDAPLSQQPEAVKQALANDPIFRGRIDPNDDLVTGQHIVAELSSKLGGADKSSERLRSAGIPGIRYYDGASRGAGQGTRNYVVFDDQLPKIVKVTR